MLHKKDNLQRFIHEYKNEPYVLRLIARWYSMDSVCDGDVQEEEFDG
jgi:hypothetical protein